MEVNYYSNIEEDIPDLPIYHILQEKVQMLEDERDYYMDQSEQLSSSISDCCS
jgi:hypothetical protein